MANTIFYSLTALVRKILFCHSKIKFISSRHRVISSLYRRLDLLHSLIFLLTFFLNYLHPSFYTCMNQWWVQGRGPGVGRTWAPVPLLPRSYFWTKLEKFFGRPSPLPPPPPLLSPYPKVWIRHREHSYSINGWNGITFSSPVSLSSVFMYVVFELPFFSPPMCRRPK